MEYRKELTKIITKVKQIKTIFKDRYFRLQTWVCKNVYNEVLLVWFKYQAKTSSRSGVCVLGEWQKFTPPSPLLTKDERLRDIEHSMRIENLVWGVNIVTVSYLIRYDSLLQNTTNINTKCDRFFIAKCESCYKMQHIL